MPLPAGPEVLRVPGVRGANAWLVRVPGGAVLVDTGLPGNAPRIAAFLAAQGLASSELEAIVLTHHDPDHGGSAAALKALTGAPVAIHPHDAAVLSGGFTPAAAKGPWRRATALRRLARLGHEAGLAVMVRLPWPGNPWRRLSPDLLLRDGDVLHGLRVVHAPGHTAGSIALATPEGRLLAGDAVFGDARGGAHYPPPGSALDPAQARETARRLVAGGFVALYPGHGAPVAGSG
ncbi:MAG: MBL fold metallo-hydrolase [Anaeromyxobacteraceae bacterium]|nr:MBL fold metallo-hydrolase [Anaeromyxobacteraceae bacterium]